MIHFTQSISKAHSFSIPMSPPYRIVWGIFFIYRCRTTICSRNTKQRWVINCPENWNRKCRRLVSKSDLPDCAVTLVLLRWLDVISSIRLEPDNQWIPGITHQLHNQSCRSERSAWFFRRIHDWQGRSKSNNQWGESWCEAMEVNRHSSRYSQARNGCVWTGLSACA